MIYEYALEPDLVATWTDRHDCRYFMQSFGFGQGRIVSRYPKSWQRRVWNAFEGTDDFARVRLTELLARLSERMVQRCDTNWEPDRTTWLENAEREHGRRPFCAILARANPRNHAGVLTETAMDEDNVPGWAVSHGRPVARNAAEMAEAVAPLLRCSSTVIFVDPYFGPERPRYRRPFKAFLERMNEQRPGKEPKRVEVHTAAAKTGTEEFFRGECETRLRRCVPEGIRVRVRRLNEKLGGEKLHNRYILTDLGGVTFGSGLGDGAEGETDDLTLMDRGLYELRWSQYGGDPPEGFLQEGTPIEVAGTRRLPRRQPVNRPGGSVRSRPR